MQLLLREPSTGASICCWRHERVNRRRESEEEEEEEEEHRVHHVGVSWEIMAREIDRRGLGDERRSNGGVWKGREWCEGCFAVSRY